MKLVQFTSDAWSDSEEAEEEVPRVRLVAPSDPTFTIELEFLRAELIRGLRTGYESASGGLDFSTFGSILHASLAYDGGGLFRLIRPNNVTGGEVLVGVSAYEFPLDKTGNDTGWLFCCAWVINGVAGTDNVGGFDGPEEIVRVLCAEITRWDRFAAWDMGRFGGHGPRGLGSL